MAGLEESVSVTLGAACSFAKTHDMGALVFSLDEVLTENGKLTDFGSSRNINLLMTNMTFTKGIGTPTYMAPEVLNKEKYKKAADVYSFGVMMYECSRGAMHIRGRSSRTRGSSRRLSRAGAQLDAGHTHLLRSFVTANTAVARLVTVGWGETTLNSLIQFGFVFHHLHSRQPSG